VKKRDEEVRSRESFGQDLQGHYEQDQPNVR
jgi:hypothetical protein